MAHLEDCPRDASRQGRRRRNDIHYFRTPLTLWSIQGYEVSDEELEISYDTFRSKYSDSLGMPEYVLPMQDQHEINHI